MGARVNQEVAEYGAIPSPEDVFKRQLKRLPARTASILLSALSLISWVTLPVNFISSLAELKIVIDLWSAIYSSAAVLRPVLDAVVAALRPVIEGWRVLTAPLKNLLAQWLPEWFSVTLSEIVLIVLICLPPLIQFIVSRAVAEQAVRRVEIAVKAFANGEERHADLEPSRLIAAKLSRIAWVGPAAHLEARVLEAMAASEQSRDAKALYRALKTPRERKAMPRGAKLLTLLQAENVPQTVEEALVTAPEWDPTLGRVNSTTFREELNRRLGSGGLDPYVALRVSLERFQFDLARLRRVIRTAKLSAILLCIAVGLSLFGVMLVLLDEYLRSSHAAL